MTIEERVDRMEAKLGSQDELVRELRAAVLVHARWEAQHGQAVAEHEQWLREETIAVARHREWLTEHNAAIARHTEAIAEHDREMGELREHGKLLDERIAKLVSGVGEFHAA